MRVTADAAYDTVAVYETARGAGCDSRHPTGQRRRTYLATVRGHPRGIGRSRWCSSSAGTSGRRRQGTIVRAGWRTRSSAISPLSAMAFAPGVQLGRGVRFVLGCEILNRMTALGRTSVVSPRQVRILSVGIVRASDDSCNNASRWVRSAGPSAECGSAVHLIQASCHAANSDGRIW